MSRADLIAGFASAEAVIDAARRARKEGYARLDVLSPFPLPELDAILEPPPSRVRQVMLAGAVFGGLAAFALQGWSAIVDYPVNSGGRALFSWPAFLLVAFEMTVLGAAVSGFIAMLMGCGLPRPHHPHFGAQGIERATQDRFFLVIAADDPAFGVRKTRAFLKRLKPATLQEAPQ